MKKTLLEIVQDILNDMDSDEVNDIDDTVESQQVASIVRQCWEEMLTSRNWPHLKRIFTLDSSLDPDKPTHFRIPEELQELVEFQYDCTRAIDDGKIMYKTMKYLYPDEFLALTRRRNNLETDRFMTVELGSGVQLIVDYTVAPQYWTSFDDDYIVLDAYQRDIESTLQSRKTEVTGYIFPRWKHLSNAVPDLPAEAFPALTEEAKSTAFLALRQMANQKAEAKSQRQQRWLSRKVWRTHGGVRYQNYGRRSSK